MNSKSIAISAAAATMLIFTANASLVLALTLGNEVWFVTVPVMIILAVIAGYALAKNSGSKNNDAPADRS